jgi:hypothetical protein
MTRYENPRCFTRIPTMAAGTAPVVAPLCWLLRQQYRMQMQEVFVAASVYQSTFQKEKGLSHSRSGSFFRGRVLALALCTVLSICHSANAATIQFGVSDPQIDHAGNITLTINDKPYQISVKPGMTAGDKADAIASQLGSPSVGFTVDHKQGSDTVKLPKMPAANTVEFDGGTTGEKKDSIRISGAVLADATIRFNNLNFNPLDYRGDFAVFTGGISTDLGDFAVSLSSQFLSDTSGTTIADEMFALMEPMASSYGVDLTLNGDTLDAQFDPRQVQNGAGIIFGTTSTSSGVTGSIETVAPEPRSISLFAAGSLLLAAGRWRKRKRAPH